MFPEFDFRFMLGAISFAGTSPTSGFSSGSNGSTFQTAVSVGGALTAVRYALCFGPASFIAELRGPLAFVDLPFPINSGTAAPFAHTGFGLTAGFGL